MNIAVIPARGGSKRIPRKNIRPFDGRPMIAYAVQAARGSGLFEHVVVSTDDAEVARVAREVGAETPFTRPAALATDHAATVPVIAHAVRECRASGWQLELVCCIYPCAPFLRLEDLKGAMDELVRARADYCFPVTEFPSAIQRALKRDQVGLMKPFFPEFEHTRTQDLEPAYHDAGQFYWGRGDAWLENANIHSGGIGYQIPSWRVVDIDTPDDWHRAEVLYRTLAG